MPKNKRGEGEERQEIIIWPLSKEQKTESLEDFRKKKEIKSKKEKTKKNKRRE